MFAPDRQTEIETAAHPLGDALLARIGNTPLLRLDRLVRDLVPNATGIQVLGKAEWANPGGSVKDRAASAIVADAQRTKGQLAGPGKALIRCHQRQHGDSLCDARCRPGLSCHPVRAFQRQLRSASTSSQAYGAHDHLD